jgi:hypothetical protein
VGTSRTLPFCCRIFKESGTAFLQSTYFIIPKLLKLKSNQEYTIKKIIYKNGKENIFCKKSRNHLILSG